MAVAATVDIACPTHRNKRFPHHLRYWPRGGGGGCPNVQTKLPSLAREGSYLAYKKTPGNQSQEENANCRRNENRLSQQKDKTNVHVKAAAKKRRVWLPRSTRKSKPHGKMLKKPKPEKQEKKPTAADCQSSVARHLVENDEWEHLYLHTDDSFRVVCVWCVVVCVWLSKALLEVMEVVFHP